MRHFLMFFICVWLNGDILKNNVDTWLKDSNLTCQQFFIDTTKYPKFRAYIELNDDQKLVFSSVKSMFLYFYEVSIKHSDVGIKELLVTDYYSGDVFVASDAFYVFGSRIVSAKGDDLIPFKSFEDAKKFAIQNSGHKIFEFKDIKKKLIDYLR